MAMRSRTTFKKRQKELARQEKQRDKAARRVQRKLEKGSPEAGEGGLSDEGLDLELPVPHDCVGGNADNLGRLLHVKSRDARLPRVDFRERVQGLVACDEWSIQFPSMGYTAHNPPIPDGAPQLGAGRLTTRPGRSCRRVRPRCASGAPTSATTHRWPP